MIVHGISKRIGIGLLDRVVGVRRVNRFVADNFGAAAVVRRADFIEREGVSAIQTVYVVVEYDVDLHRRVLVRRRAVRRSFRCVVDRGHRQNKRIGVRRPVGIRHGHGDRRRTHFIRFRLYRQRTSARRVRRNAERRQQRAIVMRHTHAERSLRVLNVENRKGNRRRGRIFAGRNVRKLRQRFRRADFRRVVDRMHNHAHAEVRGKPARVFNRVIKHLRRVLGCIEIIVRCKEDALAAVRNLRRAVFKTVNLRNRQILVVRIRNFVDVVVCRGWNSDGRVLIGFGFVGAVPRRIVDRGHMHRYVRAGGFAVLIGNRITKRVVAVPVGVRRIKDLVVRNARGSMRRLRNGNNHKTVAIGDVAVRVVGKHVDVRRRIFICGRFVVKRRRLVVGALHNDRHHAYADVVFFVPVVRGHCEGIRAVEIFFRFVHERSVRFDRYRAVARIGRRGERKRIVFLVRRADPAAQRRVFLDRERFTRHFRPVVARRDHDIVVRDRAFQPVADREAHRDRSIDVRIRANFDGLVLRAIRLKPDIGCFDQFLVERLNSNQQVCNVGFRIRYGEIERAKRVLIHRPCDGAVRVF